MQIRINLDNLFGDSTHDQTLSRSEHNKSEYSVAASYSSNYSGLKMNIPIFDESKYQIQKPASKKLQSKAPSVTSIQTEYSQRMPGQRLYYESKNNVARKTKHIEQLIQQKQKQQLKQITFKPQMNKNSERILQNKAKNSDQFINRKQKQKIKLLPTQLRKQQEEIVHCTFKPQLVAKSTSGNIRFKQKNQVFQQLFNDYKIKQVKQKLRTEQAQKQADKKISKKQFQKFLQRNNQFISKVQKKNELILSTSSKYDLQTGHKMFSPKTNTFKSHKNYFASEPQHSASSPINKIPPQILTKPIFSKNYEQYNDQQSPIFRLNSNKQFNINQRTKDEQNQIKKIHQASIDQEQEQVAKEAQNFHTVHAFEYESDKQMYDKHSNNSSKKYSSKQHNSQQIYDSQKIYQQTAQLNQEANIEHCNDQPLPNLGDYLQHQIQDINQKKSDQGRTHHEGDQSRVQDHE